MMQIWSCLEVCCAARTVFISYFHHWSLSQWNSELHFVLLFSPIAIIVSTHIHLFYDVYLMEHTDCQAVKLLVFAACVCCFCFYLLVLFVWFLFILIFLYCKIVLCRFSVLLDGVWLSAIKRITYLLTYLTVNSSKRWTVCICICIWIDKLWSRTPGGPRRTITLFKYHDKSSPVDFAQ